MNNTNTHPHQQSRKEEALALLAQFPFQPPRWMANNHVQTLWGALMRFQRQPNTHKTRLQTPDGDFLDLHEQSGAPQHPRVLLLHGLEGSRKSPYIVGLFHEFKQLNWPVTLLEFRSCGDEFNKAKRLYHSGETTDIDFVVQTLLQREPQRPLFIAGFSLGGNVTGKWLGERGENTPPQLKAAAVVSAPFDLTVSGPHIDQAFGGIYVKHFLRSLLPKAKQKHAQYPDALDLQRILKARTFEEFDTHATAQLHGFRDAQDYWQQSGCGQFLPQIQTPTLLLSAADDPFNPHSTLPIESASRSPFLHPLFPQKGGHVGFVDGYPGRIIYWAEKQIVRFFQFYNSLEQSTSNPTTNELPGL